MIVFTAHGSALKRAGGRGNIENARAVAISSTFLNGELRGILTRANTARCSVISAASKSSIGRRGRENVTTAEMNMRPALTRTRERFESASVLNPAIGLLYVRKVLTINPSCSVGNAVNNFPSHRAE